MEKLFVYFKADDQQLVCCNPFRVSSKKIAYVEAHFDLGENWTGYDSVRAIWRNTQNFAIIGTVLDSQGICKVPTEVLTSIGQVDVNLVGSISENNVLTDRLTTYPVEAGRVDANALVDGSETAEITPSQFEQFAAAVRNDAERAREGAEDAEGYADAAAGSAEAAAGSAQSAADDAQRIAQMIQDVIEQIEDFYGVTVSVETLPAGSQATARYEEGHLYLGIPKGDKGDTGNGIASITKTGTSGLVDTYTITFTNGQTTTFAVTNGEKGDTGNGIASITKTGTSGLVDTYTITYTDGQTETFTVTNGEKGDTGNGIDRIELTSTSGYVKTYTIYFTDGSTTTFEVTDGEVSLEDYYKQFIEDTASGSIASFPDGADDIPMISVLADIDPVQDLNGYDKPWPAGGGKNILPRIGYNGTFQNITISYDEESETYTLNGSTTNPGNIPLATIDPSLLKWTEDEYYTVSCKVVSGSFTLGGDSGITYALSIFDSGATKYTRGSTVLAESGLDGYSGTGKAFSSSGDYTLMLQCWRAGTVFNNLKLKIQIEKGSSATSWTPYSNECPISGHTEVNVKHTGKNLLKLDESEMLSNGWQRYFPNPIPYAGNYKLTCQNVFGGSGKKGAAVVFRDTVGGENIGGYFAGFAFGKDSLEGSTVTITEEQANAKYIGFLAQSAGMTTEEMRNAQIQIEAGSTATDYEPYQGETKTIQFVDELGNQLTVYGGQDEIIGGVLTVHSGKAVLNGSESWTAYPSYNGFYTDAVDMKRGVRQDGVSNMLVNSKNGDAGQTNAMWLGVNSARLFVIGVYDSMGSTVADFKSYLSQHNLEVTYPLAEPQTYQLTPQQINSLLGTNNVWADTGDVEVKYRADTKLYIDKVLAS